MKALINSVIYTDNRILYGHAITVHKDKIHSIVPQEQLTEKVEIIDLQGANLTAGFIDLQLNGCGGVMVNETPSVKTLEIMQATNRRSGTTSFLPTFITASDEGMKSAVSMMRDFLSQHQNQALGLHLEGPYISKEKKGVHREEYIRAISPEMATFLLDNSDVITKITLAAENPTAEYIPEFVSKGIVVSIGHSNANFATAQQAFGQGATFATHLHNAMSAVKSGREMGVVGAVLANDNVYTGVIADGLHVEFDNIKIAKRAKGNKLCLVTDATAAAGANIEKFDFVGTTVYVRNGKCYDANGTLGGSAATMIECLENVVKHANIPLDEALRMCNLYPAQAIKVDHKLGSIRTGNIANLTAFTHDFKVIGTMVNGEWECY